MAEPRLLAGGVGHDRRERRRPVLAVADGVLVHAVVAVPAGAHGLAIVRGTQVVPDLMRQHVRAAWRAVADRQAVGIRDCLRNAAAAVHPGDPAGPVGLMVRSEDHTYELQSLMRNSYTVYC